MQVFKSSETCCSTLLNVILCYTKIFALFFGNFNHFLYLCIIKHVSLKINHHATFQFSFQRRSVRQALLPFGEVGRGLWPYRACNSLFPLHSTTNSLAETPFSACCRSGSCAPHSIASTNVSSGRSKYYLPTLRAALNCPFSVLLSPLEFPALKL